MASCSSTLYMGTVQNPKPLSYFIIVGVDVWDPLISFMWIVLDFIFHWDRDPMHLCVWSLMNSFLVIIRFTFHLFSYFRMLWHLHFYPAVLSRKVYDHDQDQSIQLFNTVVIIKLSFVMSFCGINHKILPPRNSCLGNNNFLDLQV